MGNYIYPKALMTKKELQEVGYPVRMIDEIAHMQEAKSVVRRTKASGSNILFIANRIEEDLEEWRRVNGA